MSAPHHEDEAIHPPPRGFLRKYVFATDHKMIGRQFLFTAIFFFLLGGLMALLIRWQLAFPGQPVPLIGKLLLGGERGVVTDEQFLTVMTMHGTFMIFFAIIPFLIGAFGNFVVPLQIGARDMAFPRVNCVSYWLFFLACPLMMAAMIVGLRDSLAGPLAGWTAYPTLSALTNYSREPGQTLWTLSLFLVGMSSILGAVNYITTIVKMRAPGLSFFRLPLTVWAVFITSILVLLATPVLAGALMMLTVDRVLQGNFFVPEHVLIGTMGDPAPQPGGGHAIVWQHVFWFYSHPAVYIMILPAMGMVSDILSVFARRPIFGYRAMVFSIAGIAFLGFIVWGHHMFQSGMNPLLGTTFMIGTMLIALPSGVKVFNWTATLWEANIRFTTPMLHALAFVTMFIIGGLSGLFMASTAVDIYIHDTYFIVAHIHYVLFGGSIFGIFAGITYWFPKMFGRTMSEFWGKVHFVLTFLAFNGTFFAMHIVGLGGHLRRIADPTVYQYLEPVAWWNKPMTHSAILLGAVQLIFLANFLGSLFFGRRAPSNPWDANTLEWQIPSPAPYYNYETTPRVYRGPYEYSPPDVPDADHVPQTREPLEAGPRRA